MASCAKVREYVHWSGCHSVSGVWREVARFEGQEARTARPTERFIEDNGIDVLNVAGPRASGWGAGYRFAVDVVSGVISRLASGCNRTLQRTKVRKTSRSRAFDSPWSSEGEIGWIFDEIRNLVEPIERSATGESHATNADTGGIGWSVSGGGQHSETG
jgi:hypothetical protein